VARPAPDLNLDRMTWAHAGSKKLPIADDVGAVAAAELLEHLAEIGWPEASAGANAAHQLTYPQLRAEP
jgi:hypothetical protein